MGPERLTRYGAWLTRFMARRPSGGPAVAGFATGVAVAFVVGPTDVPWYSGLLLGTTLGGAAGLLASWPCW